MKKIISKMITILIIIISLSFISSCNKKEEAKEVSEEYIYDNFGYARNYDYINYESFVLSENDYQNNKDKLIGDAGDSGLVNKDLIDNYNKNIKIKENNYLIFIIYEATSFEIDFDASIRATLLNDSDILFDANAINIGNIDVINYHLDGKGFYNISADFDLNVYGGKFQLDISFSDGPSYSKYNGFMASVAIPFVVLENGNLDIDLVVSDDNLLFENKQNINFIIGERSIDSNLFEINNYSIKFISELMVKDGMFDDTKLITNPRYTKNVAKYMVVDFDITMLKDNDNLELINLLLYSSSYRSLNVTVEDVPTSNIKEEKIVDDSKIKIGLSTPTNKDANRKYRLIFKLLPLETYDNDVFVCLGSSGIDISNYKKDTFFVRASNDGLLYDADGTITGVIDKTISEIYIPSTYNDKKVKIGDNSFADCEYLTNVVIEEGIEYIGSKAFSNCKLLEDINIPNSTKNISANTFSGCNKLLLNQYDNAYYLGNENNKYLVCLKTINNEITSCNINANTLIIAEDAFRECSNLRSITTFNTRYIGSSSFENCHNLSNLNLTNSLKEIGSKAFSNCSSLNKIIIPNNIEKLSDDSFANSPISEATIPSQASLIFYNNENITKLTITKGEIKASAFGVCSALKEIIILDDVTYVNYGAFKNLSIEKLTAPAEVSAALSAKTLKELKISSGKKILASAFNGCPNLTDLVIADSVTEIGNNAFKDCPIERATLPALAIEKINESNIYFHNYLKEVVITSGNIIPDNAFINCSNLESIVLPNTITSIGNNAFENCGSLTLIDISKGVSSIGSYCFAGCQKLESIIIPEGVTKIEDNIFSNCYLLRSITLPNSLTYIGQYAFYNCRFSSISIPEGVKKIGESAFSDCGNLTSIIIPDSVTSIEDGLFKNCYALAMVKLSKNLTSIGNNAFEQCKKVESITIPNGVTSIGEYAFFSCSLLSNIVIPNSLTSIGNYALSSCPYLTNITIPSNVTKIGEYAFSGCDRLTTIEIPEGVNVIEDSLFYNCENLISVKLFDNVTKIGECAFMRCYNLESIIVQKAITGAGDSTLDDSLNVIKDTTIGRKAFYSCQKLTTLEIPKNITSIDSYAFELSGLTSLVIPENITSIGENAFYSCQKLTTVEIKDGLINIGSNAFINCENLTTITIPDTVTNIGANTFKNCSSLSTITIPSNLSTINTSVFEKCSSLSTITIPGSVKNIRDRAFYECTGLKSLEIQDGVVNIGEKAFYYCVGLTSVDIPSSVSKIEAYAFLNCSNLLTVNIQEGVTSIGKGAFTAYTSNSLNITLPDSITNIDSGAFTYREFKYNEYDNAYYIGNNDNPYLCLIKAKNKEITLCTINEKCKIIYEEAFYNCKSLTSVEMPNNIVDIGAIAFYNCASLESITIPNSVTNIGDLAFSNCSSLKYNEYENGYYLGNDDNPYLCLVKAINTNVTAFEINEHCTIIHSSAFYNCKSLTNIEIPNSMTTIDDYAFGYCKSLVSIEIPNSVTRIGDSAFEGCSSLISITLSNSVLNIERNLFEDCYSLESLKIPDGVRRIDYYSFRNCKKLKNIIIPESLITIGGSAFENCTSFEKVYYYGTNPYTDKVYIDGESNEITNCTWYYYTEKGDLETVSGYWWYYDTDGTTIIEKWIP